MIYTYIYIIINYSSGKMEDILAEDAVLDDAIPDTADEIGGAPAEAADEDLEDGELTRLQTEQTLQLAREKARKRAERFGTEYAEPAVWCPVIMVPSYKFV